MEEKYVFVGKNADGHLVCHADVNEMKRLDNVTKVLKKVPVGEFEAADGLIREIDGEIVVGKTDAEKEADQNTARVHEIDQELTHINFKQTRSSAEIVNAMLNDEAPDQESVKNHREREEKADRLRKERKRLTSP
jgi:hypothetical protein